MIVGGVYRLGDAVMSLPALAYLAGSASGGEVALLSPGLSAEVYRRSGLSIDLVSLPESGGLIRAFLKCVRDARRAGRPVSRAVLLSGGFVWALGAALARIPGRRGYASDGRSFLLTETQAGDDGSAHQSRVYCRVAGLPDSEPVPFPRLRLFPADRDEAERILRPRCDRPFAAVAPSASHPSKQWPAERYAALCRRITGELGLSCLLLGSSGDASLLRSVAPSGAFTAAGLPLGTVFALLERARFFIGNNSGLAHAAAAVGTPGVCLSGPSDPVRTAPLGSEFRMLGGSAGGFPERGRGPHPSLMAIAVGDVLEAAAGLSLPA